MTSSLAYSSAVLERHPDVIGEAIEIEVATNEVSPPDLIAEMRVAEVDVRRLLEAATLADLPSIAAWRRVFSSFGAKPTKYRNAAEALLRRVSKGDELPAINLLVDVGNLVSIRHQLPVAVFDRDRFPAPAVVTFATGDEGFEDLGSSTTEHPDPGEVVFLDADGQVMTRRWCWRQNRGCAASPETRKALVVIEGHHEDAIADVEAATSTFFDLLDRYCPATVGDRIMLHQTGV